MCLGGVCLCLVVSGGCLRGVWGVSERCLAVQVMFGWCVVVSVCCLEGVWGVSGGCLGGVLEMSGVSSGVLDRVQTNFENSAEYRISGEIWFRLNRNRT